MSTLRRANIFDVGKLLFVGALWGGSFIFISHALVSFGPVTIASGRISLAALVLLLICFFSGRSLPRDSRDWTKLMLIGALNSALPFFLISWGLQFVSVSESALLLASGSFVSMIISHYVSPDERINFSRALGVSVGFCGVLVLVIAELLETGPGGMKGQIAIITAGISYSISSVMIRRISHLPSVTATASILLSASVYMLPLAFILEQPINYDANLLAVLSIVCLGVVATALAYVIRLGIIRDNGAVFMSQVGYLVPLFGVFWGWLLLSEALEAKTLIALGTILVGIAITRRAT